MMKLIVNADDAGIDCSRNEGIFQALDFGIVKSISVIVAQSGWEDILKRLKRRRNVCAGLHFNLTAGKPLVKGHKTISGEDGFFFSKTDLLQRAIRGQIDSDEVADELAAQLTMMENSCLHPTHIDSHNHVHIFPKIRKGILDVVPKGTWLRLPLERNKESQGPEGENPYFLQNNTQRYIQLLNHFSLESEKLWQNHFHYLDDFRGSLITPSVTLTAFKKAVNELQGDVCELMCHPGGLSLGPSTSFSKIDNRQIERKILTSVEFKEFLEKRQTECVSFKDI